MKLFFVAFQAGHWVTVYERNDRCGGLLMYGVPPMKLSKKVDQASPASSQSHLKFQLIHAWFALVRLAIAIYGVNLGGKCKM